MIQWYINNRPVPKAIARNHLENALPHRTARGIASIMSEAIKGDTFFVRELADYGVHYANLK